MTRLTTALDGEDGDEYDNKNSDAKSRFANNVNKISRNKIMMNQNRYLIKYAKANMSDKDSQKNHTHPIMEEEAANNKKIKQVKPSVYSGKD